MPQDFETEGRLIADAGYIEEVPSREGAWLVPDEPGALTKRVEVVWVIDEFEPECKCRDFLARRDCKHVQAIHAYLGDETDRYDGRLVEPNAVPTNKGKDRDWKLYDRIADNRVAQFQKILYSLCRELPPRPLAKGRPKKELADVIFVAVFKAFRDVPGRQIREELEGAEKNEFVSSIPKRSTFYEYLQSDEITEHLEGLIDRTVDPFAEAEGRDTYFAVDSSGIHLKRRKALAVRKKPRKGKKMRLKEYTQGPHDYATLHAACGAETGVITAAAVTIGGGHDKKYLIPLMRRTAKKCDVKVVVADSQYIWARNFEYVRELGATPYIYFRENQTGESSPILEEAYGEYLEDITGWFREYAKRSAVETAFSMLKANFGGSTQAMTDATIRNEVLVKVVGHNILLLINGIMQYRMWPDFMPGSRPVPKKLPKPKWGPVIFE